MSSCLRALAAVLVVCAPLACAGPGNVSPNPGATPPARGGALRIVMPAGEIFSDRLNSSPADPATLDPVIDSFSPLDTWELMRCCLSRSLLSSNGRATEQGGARMHADLAEDLPEISADGLRWTFHLRPDVHYAPPFSNLEVTAQDVIRGFHRVLAPSLEAEITPLYSDIVGASAYAAGEATTISGLESPDEHTLIIRLTRPAGDLAPRLALPWVVPIPPDVNDPTAPFGVATGHDDGYGRFFVSSGPYMIEGSAALDFARPPAEQDPVSGLQPGQRLTLERNPAWNEAQDPLRPALPDRIEFSVAPSLGEAVAALLDGRADLLANPPFGLMPNEVADQVRASGGLVVLHVNQADFISQIVMNTAQPPFDDVHVRRAANYVIDKAHLVELGGGPLVLRPAHHLVPDAMEDNLLVDYRPYQSVGDTGDLEAAKQEIALSRYDADGDGLCDAAACSGVVLMSREQPMPGSAQAISEDLAQIGIQATVQIRDPNEFFEVFEDPANHASLFAPIGWAKDAMSPVGFFVGQFYGPVSLASVGNGGLIGASRDDLQEWGYGDVEVPNVDTRVDACLPLTGAALFECWAALDQYMMESVVPTVPVGLGVGVIAASSKVGFVWDQLAAAPSYDQMALPH